MQEKTEWRAIHGYVGLYSVNNKGQIATTRRQGSSGKFLKPIQESTGYLSVRLCKNGKSKKQYVHRIVANEFLGVRNEMEVNHKDEVRNNNKLSNLEWVTREQNVNYGHHNKNIAVSKRTGHTEKVIQMTMDGKEIANFDFLKDAANSVNGASINISRAARGVGNRLTAYGYKWRYGNATSTKIN